MAYSKLTYENDVGSTAQV